MASPSTRCLLLASVSAGAALLLGLMVAVRTGDSRILGVSVALVGVALLVLKQTKVCGRANNEAQARQLADQTAGGVGGVPLEIRKHYLTFVQEVPNAPAAAEAGSQPKDSAIADRDQTSSAEADDAADLEAGLPQKLGLHATGRCVVCLDKYSAGETVCQVPCPFGHVFHQHCIYKWLDNRRSCPVCNYQLRVTDEDAPPADAQQQAAATSTVASSSSDGTGTT